VTRSSGTRVYVEWAAKVQFVIEVMMPSSFGRAVIRWTDELEPSKFASPLYLAVMLWLLADLYFSLHVAAALISGRRRQAAIGFFLSRNSIVPEGATGPPPVSGCPTVARQVDLRGGVQRS
jgi:hypothetical protein